MEYIGGPMKKIGSIILAFALLISSLSVALHADDFEEPDVDLGVGFGKFRSEEHTF
jgi:hypothetical protein